MHKFQYCRQCHIYKEGREMTGDIANSTPVARHQRNDRETSEKQLHDTIHCFRLKISQPKTLVRTGNEIQTGWTKTKQIKMQEGPWFIDLLQEERKQRRSRPQVENPSAALLVACLLPKELWPRSLHMHRTRVHPVSACQSNALFVCNHSLLRIWQTSKLQFKQFSWNYHYLEVEFAKLTQRKHMILVI